MHITQIWTYPVKSCAGVQLQKAVLDERGVAHDRRWMVVNAENKAVTQREVPKLVWVKPKVTATELIVSAPDMPTLRLQRSAPGLNRRVWIWGQAVDAVSLPLAREWFRTYTGQEVDLVFLPDSSSRPMNQDFGTRQLTFVDGNPLHLISEASVAELNARLDTPVQLLRFRPNLVFAGVEPYAEDNWRRIRIGDIPFDVYEACQRCVVLNVDPVSAAVGREPLATLARYRKRGGHVVFGQNISHLETGVIRVGSRLQVGQVGSC